MKELIKIKIALKKFVGKNEVFIVPILKFLATFIALSRISNQIGYFTRLTSKSIILVVALAGSFLPMNLTIVIMALMVIAHLYKLSLEVAVVVLAVFLILFLIYFRFASKDSVAAILTPFTFMMKIPYLMPISMGLCSTPTSAVSVGSGVIVYELLHFISGHADELTAQGDDDSKLGQFKVVIDALLGNRTMMVYVVLFAITIIVVYLIRRLPINYCWQIAIGTGAITLLLGGVIVNKVVGGELSFGSLFLGTIISVILNIILQFFLFDLNYNKVEKVQFEDDEYYYYVKAVPKNDYVKKKPTRPSGDVGERKVKSSERPQRTESVRTESTKSERSVATGTVSSERMAEARKSQRSAVTASRTAPAVRKGPLGLSGGRPAGEGRRLQQSESKKNNE